MGILNIFKSIDRKQWFVCYNCMLHNDHNELISIFYSASPSVNVVGRPTMICPRCNDANIRSFQEIKDEGGEASLWGLERIVRKHPRSQFVVRHSSQKTSVN